MFTLAEFTSSPTHRDSSSIIVWSCVMIVVIVIGFAIVMRVRRSLSEGNGPPSGPITGFTLSDLRQMHRAGQISDDEFERAKVKIVAAARKAAERDAPAPPVDPEVREP